MKISIKKYLLYSSVFAIFTEAFFFNYIIDWKLLYLIICINYYLLFLHQKKIIIHKYFNYIIVALFVHGIIVNSIIGVPINYMLAQLIGITIISIYYYNFITLFKLNDILKVYLKISLIVAIIGYPMYFLEINLNDGRLQSIFKEPAHYAIVVIPACYYYLKIKKYLLFAVIFGTLILSNSSLGYIGCALMFIIPNLNYKRFFSFIAILPFVIGTFYYIYNEYTFLKLRVDDTVESLNAINTGNFKENANLSSYSLLSNLFVAKTNVTEHPIGSGIGSHVYMHKKKYLHLINPPVYLVKQDLQSSNATDANSMFVRIISELGIIGLVLILFFISRAYRCFNTSELYFAQGIFIYFLLKLFRDGHYFPPELFFFIWLFYSYYKNANDVKITNPNYIK
ncbi:O-antigen ligase family protein [Flavobacterium sp.]|uniref:O-antigen ligase family protein n=1 Tax=Flavobacterium sp. TaxID=239 RepID=UPI00286BA307|nr:O-antigen ligase family protein [Flavobacterium sp.]